MKLEWKFIHKGYYRAISTFTDEISYVVRTRPLNDGWMAIDESESLVMATGLSLHKAKQVCQKADDYLAEN